MKVIPVIDVLGGVVVHAVRGQRKEYKPLQSSLTKSVDPLEVAKVFKALGFTRLYVADLDAIIDCSTDFLTLKRITNETGLELMVDAGISNMERAQKLLDSGVSELIIGTETLQNEWFVSEAVGRFGSKRVVISLDLRGNCVLTKSKLDDCIDGMGFLRKFGAEGVTQVIVLDLLRVGSGEGVNMDFLNRVLAEGTFEVYVGGGVRDVNDLLELKKIGVTGALVATALHDGKISISELKQESLL
ncbi:MAG: HisA/HisF-related TIM barrel protein [Candidatus Bathyarchaeota archaeon]|nr:HisA/HisF-related TIM barrel protein [Candidatus Bathyarchaeota archaeon]